MMLSGRRLRRLHLAEQPLQPGKMLLVVAAEIMNESAQGRPSVAFEDRGAIELPGFEAGDERKSRRASLCEIGQGRSSG